MKWFIATVLVYIFAEVACIEQSIVSDIIPLSKRLSKSKQHIANRASIQDSGGQKLHLSKVKSIKDEQPNILRLLTSGILYSENIPLFKKAANLLLNVDSTEIINKIKNGDSVWQTVNPTRKIQSPMPNRSRDAISTQHAIKENPLLSKTETNQQQNFHKALPRAILAIYDSTLLGRKLGKHNHQMPAKDNKHCKIEKENHLHVKTDGSGQKTNSKALNRRCCEIRNDRSQCCGCDSVSQDCCCNCGCDCCSGCCPCHNKCAFPDHFCGNPCDPCRNSCCPCANPCGPCGPCTNPCGPCANPCGPCCNGQWFWNTNCIERPLLQYSDMFLRGATQNHLGGNMGGNVGGGGIGLNLGSIRLNGFSGGRWGTNSGLLNCQGGENHGWPWVVRWPSSVYPCNNVGRLCGGNKPPPFRGGCRLCRFRSVRSSRGEQ